MTEILVYFVGILALVGTWLWFQLWIGGKSKDTDTVDRPALNRLFTKTQADEFELDADESSAELSREIKLSLLEESQTPNSQKVSYSLSIWTRLGLVLGVPIVAFCVYWFFWGDPLAVELDRVPRNFLESETPEQQQEIYELFQARAKDQPNDGAAWYLLMQLQWLSERYEDLIVTHPLAEAKGHVDTSSDEWYLLALAREQRPIDNERTHRVLDRVVDSGRELPLMIELLNYRRAIDIGDFRKAFLVSEAILTQPLTQDVRQIIETSRRATLIPELEGLMPLVQVLVDVPEGTVDQGWLSVLVRAESGGPPLIVSRRPLPHWHASGVFWFTLSDLLAMQPSISLTDHESVRIEAKITKTAAVATDDALQRIDSAPFDPSQQSVVNIGFTLPETAVLKSQNQ